MFNAWAIDRLQRASAAVSYKQTIRTFGLRTLALAIVFIFIGAISFRYIFAALPPIVIGCWLMIYAAAMIFLVPPQAFRIGDVSGIIAFGINISLVLYETATETRAPGQLTRALPGIFILIIAFGFIHFTYKRSVKFAPPATSQNEEAQFKQTITALLKADYHTDETTLNILVGRTTLKGSLNEDFIALTTNTGQGLDVCSRHQFEIIPQSTNLKQKKTAVKIRAGQQWFTGYIDSTSYERYQQWKSRTE